jgi:hypothetical protein
MFALASIVPRAPSGGDGGNCVSGSSKESGARPARHSSRCQHRVASCCARPVTPRQASPLSLRAGSMQDGRVRKALRVGIGRAGGLLGRRVATGEGRAVKSPTGEAVRCNRMRWRGFFVTSWTSTGHKNRPTHVAAGRTGRGRDKERDPEKATEENRRHGLTRHCDLGEGLPLRGPTTSRGKLSPTRLAPEGETGVSFPPPCDNQAVVEHRSD